MKVSAGLEFKLPVIRYGNITMSVEFEDQVLENETPEQAHARLNTLCLNSLTQQLQATVQKYLEHTGAASQLTGGQ